MRHRAVGLRALGITKSYGTKTPNRSLLPCRIGLRYITVTSTRSVVAPGAAFGSPLRVPHMLPSVFAVNTA